MDEAELEHRLTEVEERSKSNTKRLDKVEPITEAINSLAASMQVMVTRQEQTNKDIAKMGESVDKLDKKVEFLEQKPGKRYEQLVEKIIWAVVGAVVAFILSHVGL